MSKVMGVLVTASSIEEARHIASGVLQRRLAACVSIVGGVESHYWWQDQLESARETLLIVKTTEERVPALIEAVRALHSYTVPEVIAFPIEQGNPDYLAWVRAESAARKAGEGRALPARADQA